MLSTYVVAFELSRLFLRVDNNLACRLYEALEDGLSPYWPIWPESNSILNLRVFTRNSMSEERERTDQRLP